MFQNQYFNITLYKAIGGIIKKEVAHTTGCKAEMEALIEKYFCETSTMFEVFFSKENSKLMLSPFVSMPKAIEFFEEKNGKSCP